MGRGFGLRPYGAMVVALLLVAASVGLDNLGAATALGVSGVDRKLRLRVALIFGMFEGAMPIIGLALGHSLSHALGALSLPDRGDLAGSCRGLCGRQPLRQEGEEAGTPSGAQRASCSSPLR